MNEQQTCDDEADYRIDLCGNDELSTGFALRVHDTLYCVAVYVSHLPDLYK